MEKYLFTSESVTEGHDLHHSSWQRQILNPLSEARDRTHVLMGTSGFLTPGSHNRNSSPNIA